MPTVTKQKTPAEALASLMRLCSRAEKSSGDARRLMRGWGVAPSDAERVLAELTAKRFIDDERYANAYTRGKMRASGWGAHKIRAALAAKGIPRELIDNALRELIDPDAQSVRLEKQLERKIARVKAATPYELRTKLTRYALSLGYDYETAAEAVEKTVPMS
ncbi:MAG: RecX family transcriptional regulator [Alistipes sp.]|jgi:regulatory protein|nr:RecX family transcriptional regulator [Alistipes sp.]